MSGYMDSFDSVTAELDLARKLGVIPSEMAMQENIFQMSSTKKEAKALIKIEPTIVHAWLAALEAQAKRKMYQELDRRAEAKAWAKRWKTPLWVYKGFGITSPILNERLGAIAESRVDFGHKKRIITPSRVFPRLPRELGIGKHPVAGRRWTSYDYNAEYMYAVSPKADKLWYFLPGMVKPKVVKMYPYGVVVEGKAIRLRPRPSGVSYCSMPAQVRSRIWESVLRKYPHAGITYAQRGSYDVFLHPTWGHYETFASFLIRFSVTKLFKDVIAAFAYRRDLAQQVAAIERDAAKVLVTFEDSTSAGNCDPGTMDMAKRVWQKYGYPVVALRGDLLLQMRNDEYTRRAVQKAIQRIRKETTYA